MEAARYLRSSSLCKKFADDFPGERTVPLQLPPAEMAAFARSVRPLLDVAERAAAAGPLAPHELAGAVEAAMSELTAGGSGAEAYALLRRVADYVQCTFAQCVLDTAAAWHLDADRAVHRAALGQGAAAAAVAAELRARLLAAGVGELAAPLGASLRGAPPPPLPPASDIAGAGSRMLPLLPGLVAATPSDGGEVLAVQPSNASGGSGGTIRVAWPALRHGLAAAGAGRYLEAVLGGENDGSDAGGGVVLTGDALAAVLLGRKPPHTAAAANAGDPASPPRLPDPSAAACWFELAIVGAAGGQAGAARTVAACVRELLTRHKMRHPPPEGGNGQQPAPLLLLSRRHLVLLLPEADAAGAAAAAGGDARPPRDVAFAVRLQLARSLEELVLPPLPPPPPADTTADDGHGAPPPLYGAGGAWAAAAAAYDGDDARALPGTFAAMADGGRLAVDPARLRAAAAELARLRGGGGGGNGGGGDIAAAAALDGAAEELLRGLVALGWKPQAAVVEEQPPAPGTLLSSLCAPESGGAPTAQAAVDGPTAALLAASLDRLAVRPAAVRHAVLGGAHNASADDSGGSSSSGGGGAAAAARVAAGASAAARALQQELRDRHGWLWAKVETGQEGGGPCELPSELHAALSERLRLPSAPEPPEPLRGGDDLDGAADCRAWFYR